MSKPLLSTVFLAVSIALAAWGCSSSSDSEAKPGDSAGALGDQETTENKGPAPATARGEFPQEADTVSFEESARLRSDAERRLWRRVEEEDSAEAYVFYLDLYPSGQFAPQACQRFVALLDPIDLRSQRMQPLLARHPVAYRTLVPSLLVTLDDRHFWIRLDAAILLADYNPFWWFGVVEAPVREKLVGELVTGLPALLKDDAVETRIAAARALATIGSGQTVRPLLDALNDEAEPVRRAAAAALGAVGDPDAITGLIGALDDPAESVAEAAAHSLGALGDPRAVKPLIDAFRKSTSPIPAQALDQIGCAAVEDLIGALDYDVQWGRQWAARSLGILQDSRAVEPLLEMFGTERDARARRATALALGALGDARAVDPLMAVLKDPQSDGTVRAAAATALGMLDSDDPDVEKALRAVFEEAQETPFFRTMLAAALGKFDDLPATQPPWLAHLRHDTSVENGRAVWRLADVILQSAGGDAIDSTAAVHGVAIALREGDPPLREAAIRISAKLGDAAVEPLEAVLRDAAPEARAAVVRALGAIGTPAANDRLIATLGDRQPDVRDMAALLLGANGEARAVTPLLAMIPPASEQVPEVVSVALGLLGDARAVEPLIGALQRCGGSERGCAAWALGMLGDPRAVEPLQRALGQERGEVGAVVAMSLVRLGNQEAMATITRRLPLGTSGEDSTSILFCAGWRPQSIDDVIHLLAFGGWEHLLPAVSDSATTVLAADIASGDRVRAGEALAVLERLGIDATVPQLLDRLRTRGTRDLADVYRGCATKELQEAGQEWIARHGLPPMPPATRPEEPPTIGSRP